MHVGDTAQLALHPSGGADAYWLSSAQPSPAIGLVCVSSNASDGVTCHASTDTVTSSVNLASEALRVVPMTDGTVTIIHEVRVHDACAVCLPKPMCARCHLHARCF